MSAAPRTTSSEFIEKVPHDFARRHLVLGLSDTQGTLAEVLHAPGLDPCALHNLLRHLGVTPALSAVDPEELARRVDEAYGTTHAENTGRVDREDAAPTIRLSDEALAAEIPSDDELSRLAAQTDSNLLDLEGKGPVVRLVDAVVFDAISRGASDIHVQPLGHATLIRFRIDGVLATVRTVPPRLTNPIVSRIKVMSRMDVAERRAAQDGRATVRLGRGESVRPIDLRISVVPSTYGERVVMRLLDTRAGLQQASVEALQMPPDMLGRYLDRASRSSGMVLVTGPTGSGKTTTLYATLRYVIGRSSSGGRTADLNVMTIEDPVEYDLSAAGGGGGGVGGGGNGSGGIMGEGSSPWPISQMQVDPKKGLTFASGLRHLLRQDPDVIMVGEIRDAETARMAIQASLTGHLVFSTLHTNDACGAVTRLIDLGVEPYLVASSLAAVLAQRLVRTLHRPCAGKGCDACVGSGFKGRRGLFELLVIDSALRELVASRATAAQILTAATANGLRRLQEEGDRLVREGITTRAEVERVALGLDS